MPYRPDPDAVRAERDGGGEHTGLPGPQRRTGAEGHDVDGTGVGIDDAGVHSCQVVVNRWRIAACVHPARRSWVVVARPC